MIFLSTLDKQDFLGWGGLGEKTELTILYACLLRAEKEKRLPAFLDTHFPLDFAGNAARLVGRRTELNFPKHRESGERVSPGESLRKTSGFRSEFQCLFTFYRGWSKP